MSSDRTPGPGEPQWLDEDERQAWMRLVAVAFRLPAALDAQLQRDSDLSHFQYLVLAMLSERPDRTLRMSQLAVLANGSLSRLSHAVSKLERLGLVRRSPCPEDGRVTIATLTDDGWDTVVAAAPGHVAEARTLVIDALSRDQITALAGIADTILGRIEPGWSWPGTDGE